ncbi:class I SAM-dependent methyltransferase [Amphibiibacter pelophylacis]|uniref:Methyltransferase domain-containing protein n=1 Tax=Amphibiibacter pelophylacis TaxID=1799477 RepID=A0ACC6P2Y3_9BURK
MKKKVLNVGGGSKSIAIPPHFDSFEHLLLDISASGNPDVICDARQLKSLGSNSFDAVYCSHNLEHYYKHDVPKVLGGFVHVLKEGGFAHIRVPDMQELMRQVIERQLDINDELYRSAAGPILVSDVIYGYGPEIESSGQDFYAHKTGFSLKSMTEQLERSGFSTIFGCTRNLEVEVIAFKGTPSPDHCALLGLSPG